MRKKVIDPNKLLKTDYRAGWIEEIDGDAVDDSIKQIINFFLVKSVCKGMSALGCTLDQYGWEEKDYHKRGYLERKLLSDAGLRNGDNVCVFNSREQEQESFSKLNLDGDHFYKDNEPCRIALLRDGTVVNSICKRIRNSMAHCRVAIMGDNSEILVFEDGVPNDDSFEVKARMIVTKTVLLSWIDTIMHDAKRRQERETNENKIIDEKVIAFLQSNPNTTYPKIAMSLGIENKLIKMSTSRLKQQHVIDRSNNKGWHLLDT